MRLASVCLLVCLPLSLAAAPLPTRKPKPQELVVGQWEVAAGNEKGVIEFVKDGKLRITIKGLTLEGSWKALDGENLEVAVEFGGQQKMQKLKYKVSETDLETTDENGRVDKFKRIGEFKGVGAGEPARPVPGRNRELIVGKWEGGDGPQKAVLEFMKDGKLRMNAGAFNLDGVYKFLDDDNIEVGLGEGGQRIAVKLKIKVTDTELETTDEKGKVEKLRRVR
jgi:uncharacterized protein (TIGR03066 family)